MSDDGSWIHVDFVFTVLLAVANAAVKKRFKGEGEGKFHKDLKKKLEMKD